jgi:superfamily II DNA/RNA helicase
MGDQDDEDAKPGQSPFGSPEDDIEESENASFNLPSFSLSPQLIVNLERKGLTVPTHVQLEVIPKIRNARGKDLCVNAPTGSGKTLAYALPITEVYSSNSALIPVPV